MTASIFDPRNSIYQREFRNDWAVKNRSNPWVKRAERVALTALPFLSLHRPLQLPISLALGTVRVWSQASHLYSSLGSRDLSKIGFHALQTAIAVVALASTIFLHPIGQIITTVQDLIIECTALIRAIQKGDFKEGLSSSLRILNHVLYLALLSRGGLELAIASLAINALVLFISSFEEFQKGNYLEGVGHLLMGAIRLYQLGTHIQELKRNWEIETAIKKLFVGELHEKWQFPSDHLPVGIEVDGIKVISWNVLNNAYMEWVTTKDSQGLKGSMISDLDHPVQPNELTERDLLVAKMVREMTSSGHVIALQECGAPFLEALEKELPTHWEMVRSFSGPQKDQGVVLYDKSRLSYNPNQSELSLTTYPSVPDRPVQSLLFKNNEGKDFRVINAHIPGDPDLPAREEFAQYVQRVHAAGTTTIALGDNNFERDEMREAYQKAGFSTFSLHSPWKTNIDPYGKTSKAIDHLFVIGASSSHDLSPDEVLRDGNLRETIALLNPAA